MTNLNNNNGMDYDTLVNKGGDALGGYVEPNGKVYFVSTYKGKNYEEGWEENENGEWNLCYPHEGTIQENDNGGITLVQCYSEEERTATGKTLKLIKSALTLADLHKEQIAANIEYKGMSKLAATLKANASSNGLMRTMECGTIFIDTDFIEPS